MTQARWWNRRIAYGPGAITAFSSLVERAHARRILLVTGRSSFSMSGADRMLSDIRPDIEVHEWSDFGPHTSLDDLTRGLKLARQVAPDLLVGVGGGSAMDMAKLLTAYLDTQAEPEELIRHGTPASDEARPLVLVPTTSGSGSEATHFAVVYIGDSKFSVAGEALRAQSIILDPRLAISGSPHQRAISGIDAVCQAVESLWAVGATPESQRYARHALGLLIPSIVAFVFKGDERSAAAMSIGSHLSGRAIDISKTTGAHALSYFLTTRFGVPHGNAVALTLPSFIDEHTRAATNMPGDQGASLRQALGTIQRVFHAEHPDSANSASRHLERLVDSINLTPSIRDVFPNLDQVVDEWIASVNVERLSNNPVPFTLEGMKQLLYRAWDHQA